MRRIKKLNLSMKIKWALGTNLVNEINEENQNSFPVTVSPQTLIYKRMQRDDVFRINAK
jgi:hypothetical protein